MINKLASYSEKLFIITFKAFAVKIKKNCFAVSHEYIAASAVLTKATWTLFRHDLWFKMLGRMNAPSKMEWFFS
jgi:hypothetical protein